MREETEEPIGEPPSLTRRAERPPTPAEEAFAAWLERVEAGERTAFEDLCARHPALAPELRGLRRSWEQVQSVVERLGLQGASRPGSAPRERVSVAAVRPGGAGWGVELVKRLERRKQGHEGPRYRTEGEVSRGGMGAIHLVWDEDLRRPLAMKVPRQGGDPAVDRQVLSRFLDEAQITGQLDHPGIVPVHELGLDDEGRLFFTMRLVQGDHLGEVFEKLKRDEDGWNRTRALGVLLRVCEAMAFAHSKGVVHRDLKPANVMVGRFGEVYVMDWGLARVLGDREEAPEPSAPATGAVQTDRQAAEEDRAGSSLFTIDGEVLGTPAYMSPEQARGELESLGPASDVYSVGAILYELLAGHRPYRSAQEKQDSEDASGFQVLDGPPESLAESATDVSPELVAICEHAMAREPEERYADMSAMAEDLRAFLENRVVRAHRTGALTELRKWVRRNRAAAASLVALVLVAALAVLAIVWTERRRTQDIRRYSDIAFALELIEEFARLGPIDRAHVDVRERWLERESALAARRAGYEAELRRLRERALPPRPEDLERDRETHPRAVELSVLQSQEADRASTIASLRASLAAPDPDAPLAVLERIQRDIEAMELEAPHARRRLARLQAEVERRRTWRFASADDQLLHDRLARLVALLAELDGIGHGEPPSVEVELRIARELHERSVVAHGDAWERAIEAIEDAPAYGGLRITALEGLVPLGPDPRSGLWEFWHVLSGKRPLPRAGGGYTIGPDTGLVLTLVPGGTFTMGAQAARPWDAAFDPDAHATESPPIVVTLDPFLLSKYELTQGQWIRLTSTNPSALRAGVHYGEWAAITRSHPVERVSWNDAAALEKWDLTLPTEAQWERAARAETKTPFWFGTDFADGAMLVNHRDRQAQVGGLAERSPYDDGFPFHAPVDETYPNGFGLHGVLGNVGEWCRDRYATTFEGVVPRPGDGEIFQSVRLEHAQRGGSFTAERSQLRVSCRLSFPPETRSESIGLRPARSLRP